VISISTISLASAIEGSSSALCLHWIQKWSEFVIDQFPFIRDDLVNDDQFYCGTTTLKKFEEIPQLPSAPIISGPYGLLGRLSITIAYLPAFNGPCVKDFESNTPQETIDFASSLDELPSPASLFVFILVFIFVSADGSIPQMLKICSARLHMTKLLGNVISNCPSKRFYICFLKYNSSFFRHNCRPPMVHVYQPHVSIHYQPELFFESWTVFFYLMGSDKSNLLYI